MEVTLRSDGLFDAVANANLTVKFAKVDLAASGDLVALVTGKKIRVVDFCLVAAGAVTVKFQTGAATDLTGAMSLITGTPLQPGFDPTGHFETVAGAKLNLVLGGSVQVSGWLKYVEV